MTINVNASLKKCKTKFNSCFIQTIILFIQLSNFQTNPIEMQCVKDF